MTCRLRSSPALSNTGSSQASTSSQSSNKPQVPDFLLLRELYTYMINVRIKIYPGKMTLSNSDLNISVNH